MLVSDAMDSSADFPMRISLMDGSTEKMEEIVLLWISTVSVCSVEDGETDIRIISQRSC